MTVMRSALPSRHSATTSIRPPGASSDQPRLRLGHRHDAGVEQHGRDADRVRAGHRRRVLRLHDDEAHLRPRVLRRHQQVDVAEDAAARLVEDEVAQRLVAGDEARLLPERVARRRRDAADDDVADLAFGMAADHMDGLGTCASVRYPQSGFSGKSVSGECEEPWPRAVHPAPSHLSFRVSIYCRRHVGIGPTLSSFEQGERRMLYAILCYASEDVVTAWTKEQEDEVMGNLITVQEKYAKAGKLGPVARLLPTTAATTLRKVKGEVARHRRAVCRDQGAVARLLHGRVRRSRRGGRLRARTVRRQSQRRLLRDPPGRRIQPGRPNDMTDISWIDPLLSSARPQAVAALLRYFRDLDTAEEAFQEACLRALKNWPQNGPPRDPTAWLIFVGRNAAIDAVRRRRSNEPLPDERAAVGPRRCRDGDRRAARRRRLPRRHPAAALHLLPSRTCRRRSRSRWRCASCRASRSSRSRAPSWSAKARWSSASPAPRRRIAAGRRAVRDAGRGRALRAARRRRGHGLSRLQRGLFGERRRRVDARAALRRGDPAGAAAACGCSRPSPRSWG